MKVMRSSVECREVCEHFEGRHAKVYICPAGFPTVGIGHKLKPGEKFTTPLSDAEIDALFDKDIRGAEGIVNKYVAVDLTQKQFDMLVDFTFNVGGDAFRTSTLLKMINRKDFIGAKAQFSRWNKAKNPKTGKLVPMAGLTRRRKCEAEIFGGKDIAYLEANNWFRV